MISSDAIRGYNDTIILYLLLEEPSYGYEISRRIREISQGLYPIKETTLYSTFTRLEKGGYISSFYGEESAGRRRTYYRVTREGEEYYRQKVREWEAIRDVVDRFIKKEE